MSIVVEHLIRNTWILITYKILVVDIITVFKHFATFVLHCLYIIFKIFIVILY